MNLPDKIRAIAQRLGLHVQTNYPVPDTVEGHKLAELEAVVHDFAHVSGFGYDGWCKVMNAPEKPQPNIIGEIINYFPMRTRDENEIEAVVITCLINREYDLGLDEDTLIQSVQCHGTSNELAMGLIRLELNQPSARVLHQKNLLMHYIDVFQIEDSPPECALSAGRVLRIVTKDNQSLFKEYNEVSDADS